MKIALCDDNPIEIGQIETILNQNRLLNYDFDFFSNGKKLLKHISDMDVKYSIYFITIEMAGHKGIDLAQQIRALDLQALIIFISNDTTHMPEVFQVQTFDYLLKPISKEQLMLTMDRAKIYLNEQNTYFDFSFGRKTIFLLLNDIVYISKSGRVAYIHTTDTVYKTYLTMSEILEKLTSNTFVRTHGSYVINLNYIVEIVKNEAFVKHFKDGIQQETKLSVPISRKFKDDLKIKYSNFSKML
ncbi:LytR/AlgR family response regulator transcription factor [Enterococcus wangshanyuanii]|uniref:DNA-binding response regulator n=1 Tax=Enterococcus wangshanyuanii TaxID=2005703 RepID=A0ABQ1PFC7_9ENTE|nr:LytTR family DNA-binding domain-containing protein [Enterococcus wangshanyuanii]GGC96131.1 DNA-binding response regulator [Enterococcus wangshanyuanii]